MPNWRRAFVPGGMFFFTVVTYQRRPVFASELARRLLGEAFRETRRRQPFQVEAVVLLPDHLHTIWTLPRDDADFSSRWSWIKRTFTGKWLAAGGGEVSPTAARAKDRRRGVWQRKYWEHLVRDVDELSALIDYIHFNPVKHGYAQCPKDWPSSSFSRWVKLGQYESDWGCFHLRHKLKMPELGDITGE